MLYAQVVLGLGVSGPFDYIVPKEFEKSIHPGMRVAVSFGFRKKVTGFVVKLSHKSSVKKLKSIIAVLDSSPVLDEQMLILTRKTADYYCCSWGEVIETALPLFLRKAKPVLPADEHEKELPGNISGPVEDRVSKRTPVLVHGPDTSARWEVYKKHINEALTEGRSVLMIVPDVSAVSKAKEIIDSEKFNVRTGVLYRRQPDESSEWGSIKQGKTRVVVGTRSAVFAPVAELGLIIVDEEQDTVYKQEQVPHYNARDVAFMRADLTDAQLLLGSNSPSLESYYLCKKNEILCERLPQKAVSPEVKVINMRNLPVFERKKRSIISRYLQDSVSSVISSGGKSLFFLNRKGFATVAYCAHCAKVLKCPRCSINLVYHFYEKHLHCHYCNFKMPLPRICTDCNSGYIKYSGLGIEKIESELALIFPQARIKRLESKGKLSLSDADIFVSTESVIKAANIRFDLIGILSIDNSLNRFDFRAGEKTFSLLMSLRELTDKKIIIQTRLPNHYCFQAVVKGDREMFYKQELSHRKQLNLPPYRHIAIIKLRGSKEPRVKDTSEKLFDELSKQQKSGVKVISVNPGEPARLRGNFYWQILLQSASAVKISAFLKTRLKKFSHSGIIITVDVDPL